MHAARLHAQSDDWSSSRASLNNCFLLVARKMNPYLYCYYLKRILVSIGGLAQRREGWIDVVLSIGRCGGQSRWGTCTTSSHRHPSLTHDMLTSQPRPSKNRESTNTSLNSRVETLYTHTRTPHQLTQVQNPALSDHFRKRASHKHQKPKSGLSCSLVVRILGLKVKLFGSGFGFPKSSLTSTLSPHQSKEHPPNTGIGFESDFQHLLLRIHTIPI